MLVILIGLRTVTAQVISIGLRTWVSPIYQAPYAVMKLRFFRNQNNVRTCHFSTLNRSDVGTLATSHIQGGVYRFSKIHTLHTHTHNFPTHSIETPVANIGWQPELGYQPIRFTQYPFSHTHIIHHKLTMISILRPSTSALLKENLVGELSVFSKLYWVVQ